jgi:hypothetical protein
MIKRKFDADWVAAKEGMKSENGQRNDLFPLTFHFSSFLQNEQSKQLSWKFFS